MAAEITGIVAESTGVAKTALAKTTSATKTALSKVVEATQAALAKPAASVAASGYAAKTKAFILAHSIGFTAAGGVIVGIGVCYLANKFWLNKEDTAEEEALE
jgi:F0F1-type ATP synthase assembly protein I